MHRLALLLLLAAGLCRAFPAHADLYRALSDYKKGDYPHAFQAFLALAKLGQPLAQLNVAEMYHAGQGTAWSDVHAYAWAMLAAANGEAAAEKLADEIRPTLAPGSERIAGWLTQSYSRAALERTLLPVLSSETVHTPNAPVSDDAMTDCERQEVSMYALPYPVAAQRARIEGTVLIEFTLMPDGRPRFPRIVYAVPIGVFERVAKESLLRSRFSRAPPGSAPVQCSIPYNFLLIQPGDLRSIESYERELGISTKLGSEAKTGDPEAQQLYGLLLDGEPISDYRIEAARRRGMPPPREGLAGLPWLVKAAQGGMPVAQYEVAHDLMVGYGCRRDKAKALTWLRMAADQSQPNADIALAIRLLHGAPRAADVVRAKAWLARAAGSGTADGSQDAQLLLAAVLAATPDSAIRDPRRALELLSKVDEPYEDPTPFEIRAAAEAAESDFTHAVRSERTALSRARQLGWELAPLKERLSRYASRKPWYGNLLEF
ncbi:MAG: TonB family protein [Steroidobacteraceae bacterium]